MGRRAGPLRGTRTELAQRGWPAAERTIRRTLHRLGWRWKRPKYVLGRPDPAYVEKNPLVEQAAAAVAAGGEFVCLVRERSRQDDCAAHRPRRWARSARRSPN